jgi:hypothetical protein
VHRFKLHHPTERDLARHALIEKARVRARTRVADAAERARERGELAETLLAAQAAILENPAASQVFSGPSATAVDALAPLVDKAVAAHHDAVSHLERTEEAYAAVEALHDRYHAE